MVIQQKKDYLLQKILLLRQNYLSKYYMYLDAEHCRLKQADNFCIVQYYTVQFLRNSYGYSTEEALLRRRFSRSLLIAIARMESASQGKRCASPFTRAAVKKEERPPPAARRRHRASVVLSSSFPHSARLWCYLLVQLPPSLAESRSRRATPPHVDQSSAVDLAG